MNRNRLLIGVAGVALAGAVLLGMATPGTDRVLRGGLGESPFGRLVRWNLGRLLMLGEELNLTDEQHERIRGIMESHRVEAQPIVRDLVDKRRVLRDAMFLDEISEVAIRNAVVDMESAVGDAVVLRARIGKEVRQVLTQQQFEVLMRFMEERDNRVDLWIDELGRSSVASSTPGS